MTTFQRARRPEQVAARRAAILTAAAEMLAERQVADISLRELAGRVGLAKSNVLRYFDSREAIFLEVLDRTWTAWLDELDLDPGRSRTRHARETRVATAIAASLTAEPLLCDLFAAMASVLERNISLDVARDFKRRFTANTGRLAGLVRAAVPVLDDAAATHFAGAVVVLVAGLRAARHADRRGRHGGRGAGPPVRRRPVRRRADRGPGQPARRARGPRDVGPARTRFPDDDISLRACPVITSHRGSGRGLRRARSPAPPRPGGSAERGARPRGVRARPAAARPRATTRRR